VLNYGQDNSVHHLGDDGNWESFMLNNSATKFPLDIMVAQNNDKWLRLSESTGGGVFVFNEESGKQRLLNNTANNGALPSSEVHTITEDLDGRIWIGTSRGFAYFNSSSSVNDNNGIDAITPKIAVGKNIVPVLKDEKVLSITVDSGNRKWIGTENGVWLFDENGEEEIENFNIENSPLPSNKILSIDINPSNGEVFFATDQGLVSYRGTATKAEESHQSVKIFPNPITNSFTGLVSISGLTSNAIVKITDISGKLIRQMQSNGGTAIWDVKDYQGNRASSGVYLVFSATEDGGDSIVGKLAVVN
jgi:ligand-binding sensor domain-containing protein